jgi:membrane associated rhomboid family serine protease
VYFFYYVPVGLDIRIRHRTAITYFIAAICVILFFIYRYRPAGPHWNLLNLAFLPAAPSFWTSLTHAFLHTGYFHITGNIVYLVLFGRALEDRLGTFRFFLVFALSAVAGVYTHLFFVKQLAPDYLGFYVVGASGATSGLLGAFLVRFYYSRIKVAYWIFLPLQATNRAGKTYVPVICAILLWLLLQSVQAILQFGTGAIHVAYSVHIGGFAAGTLLAILFRAHGEARAEKHLVRARNYFQKANWFASQAEYINYLAARPDDAHVHVEAAQVFRCSGDVGKVNYHYLEAIKHLMNRYERGEAEDVFSEAMRAVPGFILPGTLHLDLAYGMERTLKFRSAARAYRNFIERYRSSCETPFVLLRMAGMLEKRFQRPVEALYCYDRLVKEHPDDRWVDYARYEIDRLRSMNISLFPNADERL